MILVVMVVVLLVVMTAMVGVAMTMAMVTKLVQRVMINPFVGTIISDHHSRPLPWVPGEAVCSTDGGTEDHERSAQGQTHSRAETHTQESRLLKQPEPSVLSRCGRGVSAGVASHWSVHWASEVPCADRGRPGVFSVVFVKYMIWENEMASSLQRPGANEIFPRCELENECSSPSPYPLTRD